MIEIKEQKPKLPIAESGAIVRNRSTKQLGIVVKDRLEISSTLGDNETSQTYYTVLHINEDDNLEPLELCGETYEENQLFLFYNLVSQNEDNAITVRINS